MTIHDLTIEQMREIVEGAPDGATDYRKLSCATRYVRVGGRYAEWWNGQNWCRFSAPFNDKNNILRCKPLKDLRTAIAEYDSRDFKVGDLVVFDTSKEFCAKLPHDLMSFRWRDDADAIVSQDGRLFVVSYGALRKAETEEIKAGHRLNHIDDVTDMVTDIKNHLSPSTKVVDL